MVGTGGGEDQLIRVVDTAFIHTPDFFLHPFFHPHNFGNLLALPWGTFVQYKKDEFVCAHELRVVTIY